MNAGRFENGFIDADEITVLEYVKERLTDIYERLRNFEITDAEAMDEINDDPTVKRFFLIEYIEIARDELRYARLSDYVDGFGYFGHKENVEKLLTKIIDAIKFRIDHYLRTSTAKNAGGLMLP